jgi:amidohydrolase
MRSDSTVFDDESRQALAAAWQQALLAELPAAIALRHKLHSMPELSGFEDETADLAAAAIGGFAQPIAGTGRLLRVGPASGPSVGLRTELDALPLTELTGAPSASTNGAMHACGHDVHVAAAVAAARAFATVAAKHPVPAALLVVLQPREEVPNTGAADIVASGELARHDVRAMIAAHLQPQVNAGDVAIDAGPVNAAVQEFTITITGRAGHGAYPHLTIDPVPALCRSVLAMQDALRSSISPMRPGVISVTRLEGSAAGNVIPEQATAVGTLRTMSPADGEAVRKRMAEAVTGIAAAHGCTGRIEFALGDPVLINDSGLALAGRKWLPQLGGRLAVPFASCGADDFAWYADAAPVLMMFVGTGSEDGASTLHDAHFMPSDDRVGQGAQALLAGCLAAFEGLPDD